MKLKAPTLTPGKRQQLEKTKSWLEGLRASLSAKQKEFGELAERLQIAETRRSELSGKAALDSEAAVQLAGVEQQIAHLSPIIKLKGRILQNDVEVAGRQIGAVRKDDIGDSVRVPLFQQVKDAILHANAPFFPKDRVELVVSHITMESLVWRAASTYINRCAPQVPDAETAIKWLAATADEIGEILSGETIITVEPATETFSYPDLRAIERHSINL